MQAPVLEPIERPRVGVRHRGAVHRRSARAVLIDFRQRAERSPAGSWPHRIGFRFRRRLRSRQLRGQQIVTQLPLAVRAPPAGSALEIDVATGLVVNQIDLDAFGVASASSKSGLPE